MAVAGDITQSIRQLQAGEREVVQRLWEGYYQRLVSIARQKPGQLPRGGADEEDVALSAFDSFIRGAENKRFPQLADRDDLWQLLVVITKRKAADLGKDELRDVALLEMEGFTNQEIADKRDLALSAVERRFVFIRKAWKRAAEKDDFLPQS